MKKVDVISRPAMGRRRQRQGGRCADPALRCSCPLPGWSKCRPHLRVRRQEICAPFNSLRHFQHGQINIIGNGVVLDPVLFKQEAEELIKSGVDLRKILKISKKLNLIMPTHRLLDAANEKAKGGAKIGTTGKGIGPTYTDKVSRNGLRLGDTLHNFPAKYEAARNRHIAMLKALDSEPDTVALTEMEAKWLDAVEYLQTFDLIDSEFFINKALENGESVLCEGAQGTMLDV